MATAQNIPDFGLYGETARLPDVVHFESFSARAPLHDWYIAPHRHTQMSQLLVISKGTVTVLVDVERLELSDHSFMFIPAACVHELTFRPGTEGYVFSLPMDVAKVLDASSTDVPVTLSNPVHGQTPRTLATLLALLRETANAQTPYRTQTAIGLIHAVLATVADFHNETPPFLQRAATSHLSALDQMIDDHLCDGWSASRYAGALGVSRGHLSRLCRRATGMGAAAYIEQKAMAEASRMLAFTQLPVSEVGYRLGYQDPSYFSKRFHKSRGQSPSSYRALFTA